MAPEVINTDDYGHQADIFSFSMLLYYMVHGEKPFADQIGNNHLYCLCLIVAVVCVWVIVCGIFFL